MHSVWKTDEKETDTNPPHKLDVIFLSALLIFLLMALFGY